MNTKQVEKLVEKLNAIHGEIQQYKTKHPESRSVCSLEIGSLLNGYREGDVSFDFVVDFVAQQRQDLLNQVEREVIGEDDNSLKEASKASDEGKDFVQSLFFRIEAKNQLRAEQRQKLAKLRGGDE